MGLYYQVKKQTKRASGPVVEGQVLLSCLVQASGQIPLRQFFDIWKHMLPESKLGTNPLPVPAVFPAPDTPANACSEHPDDALPALHIREGPD
ncbi:MAG: hypothetical protein IT262_09630 [Saprospiraceae bacterium]|nr:hypothetical protein [Saprospiraceae bacterium]